MSKLVSTTTEKPDSSKYSSNAVIFVIKVVIYILNLILSGKTESEAIRTASVKHNIPVSKVKDIWKNHK